MPKGGILPKGEDGSIDHLYKSKWRLGKTTAIRIPIILKDFLLSLARQLDKSGLQLDSSEFVHRFTNYQKLQSDLEFCRQKNLKLEKKNQKLNKQIQLQDKQNKYQIAVECFEEFVENQNLNIEELSKSRKGTKKHQLWMIRNWLESQENS